MIRWGIVHHAFIPVRLKIKGPRYVRIRIVNVINCKNYWIAKDKTYNVLRIHSFTQYLINVNYYYYHPNYKYNTVIPLYITLIFINVSPKGPAYISALYVTESSMNIYQRLSLWTDWNWSLGLRFKSQPGQPQLDVYLY